MSRLAKRRKLSEDIEHERTKDPETDTPDVQRDGLDQTPKDQRRTLFVRSLPPSVTTERLVEIFSQSRPLKHATVVLDPHSKTPKGYGFVTFVDSEDAQTAIVELNNTNVEGRKIKVELAESRHRDIADGAGNKSQPAPRASELKGDRAKKRVEAVTGRLIVRNLPWTIKESEDLAIHFRSYGKVKQAIVPKLGLKLQAGFGIVVLRGRKNAEKAIKGLNGKIVNGRPLAVDWAVDKETWEKVKNDEPAPEGKETEETTAPSESGASESTSGVDDGVATDSHRSDSHDANDEGSTRGSISDIESGQDDTEEAPTTTVFIRNLPFATTDEVLQRHFSPFGAVRYARVVYDPETERPKGTGFVCFFNEDDARSCVKYAPKDLFKAPAAGEKKGKKGAMPAHSVLENEMTDPSGRYTIEGRVLIVSRALSKSDASRREADASSKRALRDHDKRGLYLLSEGTVSKGSKLYDKLGQAEVNIREASMKQRKKIFNSNPSLHVSLTRLSVRNVPRNVSSKDLKALARQAVVGFATDVKNGLRLPLSKEELRRSADVMTTAERTRKQQGKGIVKQAKVVFEGREGSKVEEKSGAGRSRGYGFIEYVSHRTALMGLRWLNGYAVKAGEGERSKRLVVEFAIENVQVLSRRTARESKPGAPHSRKTQPGSDRSGRRNRDEEKKVGEKRKRPSGDVAAANESTTKATKAQDPSQASTGSEERNKMAKRNRIISKKRTIRRARKAG